MLAADHETSETDAGPRSSAPGTERLCIVTRAVKPTAEMLRFVVGPDGSVVPDIKRKLPGRGVWVTASRDAVTAAVERKVFGRAFKREVKIPAGLVTLVERLLERSALDALAILHKSGQVAHGFSKVEATVDSASIVVLIHAADASDDGVRKLAAAMVRRFGDGETRPPQVTCLTSEQLDLALGRSNVVHAAVLAGPAGDGFLARCRGLERFRSEDPSARTRARGRKTPVDQRNSVAPGGVALNLPDRDGA